MAELSIAAPQMRSPLVREFKAFTADVLESFPPTQQSESFLKQAHRRLDQAPDNETSVRKSLVQAWASLSAASSADNRTGAELLDAIHSAAHDREAPEHGHSHGDSPKVLAQSAQRLGLHEVSVGGPHADINAFTEAGHVKVTPGYLAMTAATEQGKLPEWLSARGAHIPQNVQTEMRTWKGAPMLDGALAHEAAHPHNGDSEAKFAEYVGNAFLLQAQVVHLEPQSAEATRGGLLLAVHDQAPEMEKHADAAALHILQEAGYSAAGAKEALSGGISAASWLHTQAEVTDTHPSAAARVLAEGGDCVSPLILNSSSLANTGLMSGIGLALSFLDPANASATCTVCGGNGKCPNDYPRAGSGKTMMGEAEPQCGGSGSCYTCGGDGVLD